MKFHKKINSLFYLTVVISLALSFMLSGCGNKNDDEGGNTTATSSPTLTATIFATEKITESTIPTDETEATLPTIQEVVPTAVSTMAVEISTEILENQYATEKTTVAVPTEALTQQPTDSEALFERLVTKSGCTIERIEAQEAEQLIIVDAYGVQADVYMFEKNNENLWIDLDLKCSGYVGANGVDQKQMEGDKITPQGLYSVGDAFYIENQPSTWLNTFKITDETYWVDDPDSAFYNMKVEGDQNKDWNSAEHMIDYYSSYKYGCVINYNTNTIESGKGSAIFMHCGNSVTSGCIAVPEADMLRYLEVLNTAKNPYILIF